MKVRLAEYDEKWPELFRQEAIFLQSVFGGIITEFEHFGSTAVKGMKAKPVIDMMCIVKDIGKVDLFNQRMEELGYDAAGEWGISGRRLFRKGGEERTHHIHFYQSDNPQIDRHLIFRDYLRANPDEADCYSAFKEELAARHATTAGYSPAKKQFVQEMEERAFKWRSSLIGE